jgi:lipid II isoglutaminyl synthase (glutamine-hydrolysing)
MLEIIRIHNELLGTYGDRGNADVLKYRAGLRKIAARVTDISYLDPIPKSGDIYLLGGAEDAAQILSLAALRKGSILARAANKGAVVLAICAGFQILGTKYVTRDEEIAGLGMLDVITTPGDHRLVGDIAVATDPLEQPLTGFENHSSVTTLGTDASPFGKVLQGNGNGVAGIDGAINKNVFGTYLHGPVLARNPEFADLLLERAVGSTLSGVNDELAMRYATWRRALIK